MPAQTILYLIIAITTFSYLFGQFLEYLNIRSRRLDIPDEVSGFYDKEKYQKSIEYHQTQTRFSFLTSGIAFVVSILMLSLGGFGWLNNLLQQYINSEIPLALAFFGVLALTSDGLTIPFQLYSTFRIEEKYGFNKTTVKTFITDKLKGYLLGAIIGGLLLSVLILLIQKMGPGFWIWFGLVASAFILLANLFYTSLILPLFNKLTPLENGELKTAIEAFAKRVSFPLDNIFVMDGSKRSKKANAFFSGIGKKKKIVLYDTLITNHTTDELVAVLAHEVGHFKKKHIIFGLILSVIQIFFMLWVLSLIVSNENVSLALGGTLTAIHLNLIAFTILFSPVSGITGLLTSIYSRRNEFEADNYAKETFSAEALSTALKRLSVDSLSNLYPHPVYVFFHYSHPPLLQRLRALNPEPIKTNRS
ncbi:peptidase M48 [Cytophagales bacterium WSM2-2]|nr:peptidase M48 [Cytophagales bacterium WSM2-2]